MSNNDINFDLHDLAFFIFKKWFVVVLSSITFGFLGFVSAIKYEPDDITEVSIAASHEFADILLPKEIAALNSYFAYDLSVLATLAQQTSKIFVNPINLNVIKSDFINELALNVKDPKAASDFCASDHAVSVICKDRGMLGVLEKYKVLKTFGVKKVFKEPTLILEWKSYDVPLEEEMILKYLEFVIERASSRLYSRLVLMPLERIKYSDLNSIKSLVLCEKSVDVGMPSCFDDTANFSIAGVPLSLAVVGSLEYKQSIKLDTKVRGENRELLRALLYRVSQIDRVPLNSAGLVSIEKKQGDRGSFLQQPKAAGVAGLIIGSLLAVILLVFVRAYR